MSGLDPGTTRRRKNGMLDFFPNFGSSALEGEGEEIYKKRTLSWTNAVPEVVREVVLLIAGVLFVLWLFWGGSKGEQGFSMNWGNRPLIQTTSSIIVPSLPGSRDGVKKAPGDMHGVYETNIHSITGQDQKQPAYLFTGSQSPSVVVLTVLDDSKYPRDYLNKIVENRLEYAQAHNYGVFIRQAKDFIKLTENSVRAHTNWARAALAREAMSVFPNTEYFWFLDETAIIMNPLVDIKREFVEPASLEPKMLRQARVVRQFDYIVTSRNNRAKNVDMVVTRDAVGITPVSIVFRNCLLSKAMFDLWMDPLYRWYGQFANDDEALRHELQWHNGFLNKVAMVATKMLASYALPPQGELHDELAYTDGDFTAYFDCDYGTEACRKEFQRFWNGRGRVKAEKTDKGHR